MRGDKPLCSLVSLPRTKGYWLFHFRGWKIDIARQEEIVDGDEGEMSGERGEERTVVGWAKNYFRQRSGYKGAEGINNAKDRMRAVR